MTEAGEKWIGDHMIDSGWKVASGHIAAEAEFWLRAFCEEVEKRTAELRKECGNPREAAFSLLKRELLGEK